MPQHDFSNLSLCEDEDFHHQSGGKGSVSWWVTYGVNPPSTGFLWENTTLMVAP